MWLALVGLAISVAIVGLSVRNILFDVKQLRVFKLVSIGDRSRALKKQVIKMAVFDVGMIALGLIGVAVLFPCVILGAWYV